MAVNGITTGNYPTDYYARQVQKNNSFGSFSQQMENASAVQEKEDFDNEDSVQADSTKADSVKEDKQESTSNTEVITRPDGSRVLLITTQVGGMQMVTSIALSQPSPLMDGLKDVKEHEQNISSVTMDAEQGNL